MQWCDFCATGTPVWSYPARDFMYGLQSDAGEHGSLGGWSACDLCYQAIEMGGFGAIYNRAYKAFLARRKEDYARLGRDDRRRLKAEVAQTLQAQYRKFFAERLGPPVPLNEFVRSCEHVDVTYCREGINHWQQPDGYYCAACGACIQLAVQGELHAP